MILREIKTLYEKYKISGKMPLIKKQDLGQEHDDAYMICLPNETVNNSDLDPSGFMRYPMFRLPRLWSKNNSILGSLLHIQFPLFLITLNGTFKQKFDSILNDVIFKEFKKYQHKSTIGGVGCLDLLYNGPVDDIKYFVIFEKQWDRVSIEEELTVQLGESVIKTIRELVFTGYFLEEKKEEYCNFYEKLLDTDCTRFYFCIVRLQVNRYHFTYWWDPLSNFYEKYIQDMYNVSPEVTKEHQILAENNKFFFRWAMYFNYTLHKMSVYKDESLEEVREIYHGLGLTGRVYINASLLDGSELNRIVLDWMLPKDKKMEIGEKYLVKSHLDNTYTSYTNHQEGRSLKSDWDFDFVTTNLFDFEHLVFQNTYGDVTAPIHPDYNKKERSISFLSSIRLASERYPRALNFCMRPNTGISVVNMDLYDELQLRLPEYVENERKETIMRFINMGFDTSELREIYRIADECKKKEIKNANNI